VSKGPARPPAHPETPPHEQTCVHKLGLLVVGDAVSHDRHHLAELGAQGALLVVLQGECDG